MTIAYRGAVTTAVAESVVLSMPLVVDLTIYRGDSGRFRVTVTDPDGLPVDVSAATWDADVRRAEDEADALATFQVVPVAGDTSSVDLILSAAESAKLAASGVWDLEMVLSGETVTLCRGQATVVKDVSRQ